MMGHWTQILSRFGGTALFDETEELFTQIESVFSVDTQSLSHDDDYDEEFVHSLVFPVLEIIFQKWFSGHVIGAEHLPSHGGGLLVANHAGVLPIDALMLTAVVHQYTHRDLRVLSADLAFRFPIISQFARKAGYVLACREHAYQLLNHGYLTAVFPEGYKGLGKHYGDRYQLQRFGRGGFVSVALDTQVPIIPCAIVGSEEIYPMMANVKPLAKLLELPYFPVTPLFPLAGPLGMIPLPSRWTIMFGPPVLTSDYARELATDPESIFGLTDHIRDVIQQMIYRTLLGRDPGDF